MTDPKKVLFIVGSLRKKSFNRQLAEAAEGIIAEEAEIEWLDYADVPFMNQDAEFPPPDSVARARKAVEAADGIWIFSPEYNHSIPGPLKNLLDWLSRPIKQEPVSPSAIKGKCVTYSSCAGESGGHYMMADLNKVLGILNCKCIDTVTTGIKLDREMFTTNVLTLSDDNRQILEAQARMLLDSI